MGNTMLFLAFLLTLFGFQGLFCIAYTRSIAFGLLMAKGASFTKTHPRACSNTLVLTSKIAL